MTNRSGDGHDEDPSSLFLYIQILLLFYIILTLVWRGLFIMEKIKRIHPAIKNNIRYKLVQKMMDDQLINWFNQPSTIILIDKLLKDCKKKATNFVSSTINFIVSSKSFIHEQTEQLFNQFQPNWQSVHSSCQSQLGQYSKFQ